MPTKAAKARGKDMRVHFKNTYEVAHAIRGMKLEKAQKYLQDVIDHKQCVPFRKHVTAGRTAQSHPFGVTQGNYFLLIYVQEDGQRNLQSTYLNSWKM